ncbi:MAG: DNA polymerase III subunit gamma/tau [Chloroflexi bacterium]|nr:DNA polymerase III subunit gamma/tau [Chloroflexota bacterium]MCY3938162.1 DNA polymerase III subunit gamma/tau [Chloroflexota bacterium]
MTEEGQFRALYNKYRPQRFAEIVGQRHIVRILQNALAHNRVSHAYMFSGDRGTGKTTVARILAKAVNCLEGVQPEPCNRCDNCLGVGRESFLDLIEIDAASNTSVDDVRALREAVRYRPGVGRYKVYLIDEVHQLSRAAYNAFLKTLEEPPEHAIFVLATTDAHRVLPTVRSRCQHLRFRKHTHADTVEELSRIATGEGAAFNKSALHMIARNSDGSLRDAIGLLDQALSYADEELTEALLREMLGITGVEAVARLTEAIAAGDPGQALMLVGESVQDGSSPATLRQELVDYFRGLLLVKTGRRDQDVLQYSEAELDNMQRQAESFRIGQIVECIEILAESSVARRSGFSPQLDLELASVQACLSMAADDGQVASTKPAAPAQYATRDAKPAPPPRAKAEGIETRGAATARDAEADSKAVSGDIAEAIRADFQDFRTAVKEWHPIYATYFEESRLSRDGELLVFELTKPGYVDALSKPDNRARLRDIVADLTGRSVGVECRLRPEESVDRSSLDTDNYVTMTAVKMYGAEIIEDNRPQ